jgi:DNA recombination protein RmuC
MNAVVYRKSESVEPAYMPMNDNEMALHLVELRADVRHLQSDVTEIKGRLGRGEERIDSVKASLEEKIGDVKGTLDRKIEDVRESLEKKIEDVRETLDRKIEDVRESLEKKIEDVRETLDRKIEDVRESLEKKIEGVREKIEDVKESLASAKLWALGIYVTGWGSMLYVLARGFKWI